MEHLSHNQTAGNVRREYVDGREFVVSQMTMIVPGVLRGSKGPLLYPADEVGKDPTPWNGMPITYKHPVRNGKNVSAKHPGVINEQGIGVVKNAKTGGKLRAEAWVDVKRADKFNPNIVKNIDAGIPVEISTGLFTTNEPAPRGSHHNGRPYVAVARKYRPDHLAVLVDERGACSVDDGCGLGVNANPEGHNQYTRLSTVQLKSHVVKAGGELASKHDVSAGGKIQTSVVSKVGTGLTISKTSAHAGPNGKDEHEHKVSWHGTSGNKETAEKQKAHVASVRSSLEAKGLLTTDGNHAYEFHVKSMRSTTSNSNPEGHNQYTGYAAAAQRASDHAYSLSKSAANDKKFKHGLDHASKARALAGQGQHREAKDAHLAAAKAIAKGRQGLFGDRGGKTHDKMEMAHVDAAAAHEQAHRSRYHYATNSNPEGHNQYTQQAKAAGKAAKVASRTAIDMQAKTPGGGHAHEHEMTKVLDKQGTKGQTPEQHQYFAKQHASMAKAHEGKLQQAIARNNQRGTNSRSTIDAHSAAALAHSNAADLHAKAAKMKTPTSNADVTANDWAAWHAAHPDGKSSGTTRHKNEMSARQEHGRAHRGPVSQRDAAFAMEHKNLNALGHVAKANEHVEKYKKAMASKNSMHAGVHLRAAEAHSRLATSKSKDEAAAAKGKKKPTALDRRDSAIRLANKHNASKTSLKASAQAKVNEAMQASKANAKVGNTATADHYRKTAVQHAVNYSNARAKQHLATAKAFAKAGDHKTAAAYQAKADFHKQHIASLSSKRMVRNTELFPSGEREFVMNQLATNANPEGHNQYSKSLGVAQKKSRIADRATEKALGPEAFAGGASMRSSGKDTRSLSKAALAESNLKMHSDAAKTHADTADSHVNAYHAGVKNKLEASVLLAHRVAAVEHRQAAKSHIKAAKMKTPTSNSYGDYKCSGAECKMKGEVANAHSELAEKTGRESDHAKASRLHQDASQSYMSHEDGPDVDRAAKHGKKAEEHKDQAGPGFMAYNESFTDDGHGGSSTHSQEEGETMAKLTANQRTATIKKLTSNKSCGCYNADDAEYLEGLSDNRLSELAEAADEHLAVNSGEEGGHSGGQPAPKSMTDQQWMDNAPPGIQAIVSNAAGIMEKEKTDLISKLVANIKDDAKRKTRTEFFQAKSLPQVREFAEAAADLAPAPVENRRQNVYGPLGNTPIVTDNAATDNDALEMTPQRFDWNTIANLPGSRKN